MDAWGCDELQPWLEFRRGLPVGPLFCVINGATRGRYRSRAELRRCDAQAAVLVEVGGRWEAGEELGELARDHRARVGPRQVRAERRADLRVRERLPERRQPALAGRRVLGQEADQLAARALRAEVARAPVPELGRIDLQHARAVGARDVG